MNKVLHVPCCSSIQTIHYIGHPIVSVAVKESVSAETGNKAHYTSNHDYFALSARNKTSQQPIGEYVPNQQ